MRETVSSAWTFPMKYLFPLTWIAMFGAGALSFWVTPDEVLYDGVRGGAPPEARWMFLAWWLVGSAFALWFARRLKRVRVVDGALLVSNYIRELRIPFGQVVRITQNRWMNPRLVTIELRVDTELGQRITFMPPSRWFNFAFWKEDPIVGALRARVGLTSRRLD